MKITIKNGRRAVIISFRTRSKKFESLSERNKFFRGLYGWKQIVTKSDSSKRVKRYRYYREGILDEVPHLKIDDSVFIVALKNMKRILKYFKQWEDKVEWEMQRIILENKNLLEGKEHGG